MNPTAKGTLWAVCAAVSLSWLPLFFLYTHTGNDPFVWRSWLILFQSGVLGLALVVMPAQNKDWRAKIRRFPFYWGDGGEPVRVRNPIELLKTPAFWMVIGFAVDLTFWVWAATLIDPLVATLVFQLFPIGMVWMAARLGRKISARTPDRAACHSRKALGPHGVFLPRRRPGRLVGDRGGQDSELAGHSLGPRRHRLRNSEVSGGPSPPGVS